MNSSIYLFGGLGKGYTQVPDDYTRDIFLKFCELAVAESQIIVHRDGNIMYYGYVRKLDVSPQYIGFCIVVNGMMLQDLDGLFTIYENAVGVSVAEGIIDVDESGRMEFVIDDLCSLQGGAERVFSMVQGDFQALEANLVALPPVNYGMAQDASVAFSSYDDKTSIFEASSKYGYTVVAKDSGFDAENLDRYKGVIKRLYDERTALRNEYLGLKGDYETLGKQKKQYKKVTILGSILLVCCMVLVSVFASFRSVKSSLIEETGKLGDAQEQIGLMSDSLMGLEESYSKLDSSMTKANQELSVLGELKNLMPIIITDVEVANVDKEGTIETDYGETIHSENTMYFMPKITYTGLRPGESITLHVKLYDPSGKLRQSIALKSDYTWEREVDIQKGQNEVEIGYWGNSSKGNWGPGTYRFEIWYGEVCLRSHSFMVE